MTRINLVPPKELMDQHLMAEFREIKMIPKSLRRSIKARGIEDVLAKVPKEFTLNSGHVSFFYNKAHYLANRHIKLKEELLNRGFKININDLLDPDNVYLALDRRFIKDYLPTVQALDLIRERISERIAVKPEWYRYYGRVNETPSV